MKKIISIFLLSLISSCVGVGVSSGPGLLFTSAKEGVQVINDQKITKTGTACGFNVLGLISVGDSSIQMAKNAGNITNVATLDRDYLSILGLYGQSCLIVNGN